MRRRVLTILASFLICGCSEWYVVPGISQDTNPYWLDTGEMAKARFRFRSVLDSGEAEFVWLDGERTQDAEDTAQRCHRYLQRTGALTELAMEPEERQRMTVSSRTSFIVGLRPTVVVITPSPSTYWSDVVGPHRQEKTRWNAHDGTPIASLPRSFDYGPHIPFASDILWFSPELRVRPQPPRFVSDEQAVIDLPGERDLKLTRSGDEWVVSLDCRPSSPG